MIVEERILFICDRLMVNPLASDHYMHEVILLEVEEEPLRSKEVFMLFDNEF